MLSIEEITLYTILGFIIVENAIEIYLTKRQIRVYNTSKKVPGELQHVMKHETFEKARSYGLDKAEYSIFQLVVEGIIISVSELYFGVIAMLWYKSEEIAARLGLDPSHEITTNCIFLFILNTIGVFKSMPFKIYSTFFLEEKHGFNKQTVPFFIKDQIKAYILSQVIMIPILAGIVYIVKWGGDYFFVYLWLFTFVVSLLLLTIYPIVIAPLFDKYTPLEEGPLKIAIEKLAASLQFPLTKLYVVEGSKRSAHSNAYFYGWWRSKRIVLFDTLLLNKGKKDLSELKEDEQGKGCDDNEIVAVLGHELGHWQLGHMTKNIIISQVNVFVMFAVFGYLFKADPLYRAIGFHSGTQPILVGLLIILQYLMAPVNALIGFGMTVLSRRFEYQADEFAVKLGYAYDLGKALIKLHVDNLGFPVYDWMYSTWYHSHPTLLQRLNRLHKKEK